MTTLPAPSREHLPLPAPVRRIPGDAGDAPSPAEFLGMLQRRVVLVVVLFIFLSGGAVGGWLAWVKYFPGYRSSALIECKSNIPDAELSLEQQRLKQDEHARFVMTQAVLLKSADILSEALKVAAVRETDWFKSARPEELLLNLTDELSAAPVRGTSFLRVSMQCRNPKDPAIIVNEVVRRWHDSVRRQAAAEFADEPLEASQAELEAVNREIADRNGRLADIVNRLPAGATQGFGESVLHQKVRQLSESKNLLHLELNQLEQLKDFYEGPGRNAVSAEDRFLVEQDPAITILRQELSRLEQNRSAAIQTYGKEHKVLKQLDAQIDAAQNKLDALRKSKLLERQADMREAARTAYDNVRHAFLAASEELLKAEGQLHDQDRLLYEYQNVSDDLGLLREKRIQLKDHIEAYTRVKTQRTAIDVTIAQSATDPLERSSPSIFLLPVGVFLALLMSGGIAIGLEMMDKSVRTSQDIVRYLGVALLGLIPHTDDEEVDIDRVETAVRDAPHSMLAEVFRRIRTSIQYSAPPDRQRTLLVTSPTPEDGKTTVACNLAMAIAQGGRRVLLVDANFRRPGLARVFEKHNAAGLSNVLAGDGTLASHIVRTDIPLLDLLETGPSPDNPVELLGGEHIRLFLTEATSLYDQIVIDAAPILLASETLVLSAAVDGVVIVVRANRNSRGVVRRACSMLEEVGAHVFGAVLNAAQVTRGGYFREQLRSYYEYKPEKTAGAASPRAIVK